MGYQKVLRIILYTVFISIVILGLGNLYGNGQDSHGILGYLLGGVILLPTLIGKPRLNENTAADISIIIILILASINFIASGNKYYKILGWFTFIAVIVMIVSKLLGFV